MKVEKFLGYANKYDFDVVPFEVKGEGRNKTKKPLLPGWDGKEFLKNSPLFQSKLDGAEAVSLIMKKNGISMGDNRFLVCLDIDDKQTGGEVSDEVLDMITNLICSKYGMTKRDFKSMCESSTSNGYHIFFTTDNLVENIQIKLERGAMIEVFTKSRCIICAPSEGYEVVAPKHECVNFDKVASLHIPMVELKQDILSAFGYEDRDVVNSVSSYTVEVNEEYVHDFNKIQAIEKKWAKLNTFLEGKTDEDWNSLAEGYDKGSYNFVRFEIMPWMIITGQKEKFLDKIKRDFGVHYSSWKTYPDKWEEAEPQNRVMGKVARKYLKELGYINKASKKKPFTELMQDYMLNIVPESYEGSIIIDGGVYTYNQELSYYEFLGLDTLKYGVIKDFKSMYGYALSSTQANVLADTLLHHIKTAGSDRKQPWAKPYYLFQDRSYLSEVPLVFRNGTLYMRKDGVEFVEDLFLPEDRTFFSFPCDYDESLLVDEPGDSVIYEWFTQKLPDEHAYKFTQKYFGSLLVPQYTPQVALALCSAKGGTGKSTLADTLRLLLDPRNDDFNSVSRVSTITASKFGDKNEGADLAHAIINISMETDRKINHEAMKVLISREKMNMSLKYVNAFDIRPLAKHLILGNKRPEYVSDGGMARRMVVFELNDVIVRRDTMTGAQFGRAFEDDWKSLLRFMLGGLRILFSEGFDDLSREWMDSIQLEQHRVIQGASASTVAEFLLDRGYYEILKSEEGVPKDEMYASYESWMKSNYGDSRPLPSKTFKTQMSSDTFINGTARIRVNGKQVRVVTILDHKMKALEELLEEGAEF